LYGYCRSLLSEPADAAGAVRDTFVVAQVKLPLLRDPSRLRPWLYAVARNECHRRLRARARSAELDEAGEVTDDDAPEVGAAAEGEGEAEAAEVVIRFENAIGGGVVRIFVDGVGADAFARGGKAEIDDADAGDAQFSQAR